MPHARRHHRRWSNPGVEVLESRQLLATAGSLDPSFAGGRAATSFFVTAPDRPPVAAVAVQADGKVVAAVPPNAGGGGNLFLLERFDADGSPDRTVPFASSRAEANDPRASEVDGVLVQPDGRIIVYGSAAVGGVAGFFAARFDANLAVDPTFGQGGEVALTASPLGRVVDRVSAALGPDGQIILASTALGPTDLPTLVAARLDADGSPDATFGTSGVAPVALTHLGFPPDQTPAYLPVVAVQPDGRVLVATEVGPPLFGTDHPRPQDVAVVRLARDGALDSSFGTGFTPGQVLLTPPAAVIARDFYFMVPNGLTVQPDGRIVVSGSVLVNTSIYQASSVVDRLAADGSLDPSFGMGGMGPLRDGFDATGPAIVQADGRIVVAGTYIRTDFPNNFPSVLASARFTTDGRLDSTYGLAATVGLAQTSIRALSDARTSLALAPDGNYILAAPLSGLDFERSQPFQLTIARALAIATPTPIHQQPANSFSGYLQSDVAVYLPAAGAFQIRSASDGAQGLIPFGLPGAGQTLPAVGDYDGAGHAEFGAYLPGLGIYAYRSTVAGTDVLQPFGIPGPGQTLPSPGDFAGTGRSDVAVYLTGLGAFGIRPAGTSGASDRIVPFGIPGPGGSLPVPGDYFGLGYDAIAVYLPSLGAYAIRNPTTGQDALIPFGLPGAGMTIPVPGDYDGSGRTELAVYLPSLGLFAYRPLNFIVRPDDGRDISINIGVPGDAAVPIAGDYSGSGHDEIGLSDQASGDFTRGTLLGALPTFTMAGTTTLPTAPGPVAAAAASPVVVSRSLPEGPLRARRVGRSAVMATGQEMEGVRYGS